MPLVLTRDDVSRVDAEAVVNAANEHLSVGGGVCGAIFEAAGRRELESACKQLGGCPTGSAVVTPGFGLKAAGSYMPWDPYGAAGRGVKMPCFAPHIAAPWSAPASSEFAPSPSR